MNKYFEGKRIIQIIPSSGYEIIWKGDKGEPDWVEPVRVLALIEEYAQDIDKTFTYVVPLTVDASMASFDEIGSSSNFGAVHIIGYNDEILKDFNFDPIVPIDKP